MMIDSDFRQQTHRALLDAFDQEHLAELLRDKLEVRLDRIIPPGPMSLAMFNVLKHVEMAGWLPDLIKIAYEEKPESPALAKLYQTLGFSSHLVGLKGEGGPQPAPTAAMPSLSAIDPGLESAVQAAVGLSAPDWRRHLRDIEPAVCRVEVKGLPRGTGFLVGPDLVLTTSFVVEGIMEEPWKEALLRFRFDYRGEVYTGDSGVLRPSQPDWLVCKDDDLPFALVRLQPEEAAKSSNASATPRRWLPIPAQLPSLQPGDPLVLAQYPNQLSEPLTISVAPQGVEKVDVQEGQLLHGAESGPGSAGAPCFDRQFTLVGMHFGRKDSTGAAILITTIREKLAAMGLDHLLIKSN